jgi:broad-specificity NMP kinase
MVKNIMMIELIGLPGSGKSTYSKKYIEEYKMINLMDEYLYSDSRVKQNINKVKLVSYLFNKKKKYCFVLYKIFSKIEFSSLKKKLKMLLYLYSVVAICEKAKSEIYDNDIIIDEGVNQVIWGLLYNSEKSERAILDLQGYLKEYFGDEIIFLQINKKILEKRLLNRNGKGGAELNHDIKNNREKLNYAYTLMEKVKNGIEKNGVTINASESV